MAFISVQGRVGKDAEMSATPSGFTIAKFSIAEAVGTKEKPETAWHYCKLLGKFAEWKAPQVKRGCMVHIEGKYIPRAYQKKDGTKSTAHEITVDKITIEERKSEPSDVNFGHDVPFGYDE